VKNGSPAAYLRTVRHTRTVHTQPMDRPPNLVHQKPTDKMDQTEDTKELAMNTKNNWLKASSWTVHMGSRTVR
jgi:hypothetical protein